MITTIILNAPPAAGKDLCADFIADAYGANHIRFKDSLYEIAAEHAEVPVEVFKEWATDRKLKEIPLMALLGLSPREWLIRISEEVIKPTHGKDYFGKATAAKLQDGLNVISDSGFIEEFYPVADASNKVVVVQLYRDGCSFEGDSRSYLNSWEVVKAGASLHVVTNNGTKASLYKKLMDIVDIEVAL